MNTLNKSGSPKQDALEVVISELEKSLKVLATNLDSLKQCVDTDDLTRLMRRGAFMGRLHNLLHKGGSTKTEVTIMMIDVDHFKNVNDSHGHQTGDVVLQRISSLINQYMRPTDLAGRYGGEEIIVAMEASESEALVVAESIRKAVAQLSMVSKGAVEFQVTLSVGIASTHEYGFEADTLIGHADAALYDAKRSGRNRTVAAHAQPALKAA
jgi:diguanylate cyclase (GGDEF)-like protein